MQKFELRVAILMVAATLLLGACNLLKVAQPRDDKAITSDIQAKLFEDPVLKARDIHVMTQNGVVSLAGTVGTDLEKAAVERLAGQVSGVKSVMNQLTVAPQAAAATPPQPAEVAQAEPAPEPPKRPRHHAQAKPPESNESPEPAPAPEENPPAPESAAAPAPTEAAAPAPAPAPAAPPAPAPPPPQTVNIPASTVVTVRMIDSIDSTQGHAGDEFAASVDSPVVVDDKVVIPKGADARVRLVQATSAGRMSGSSDLKLELVGLTVRGTSYAVASGYYEQQGPSRGKRSAEVIGGGTVLGTLLGAAIGGGRGAAIGAGVGAAGGTATQAGTHGQPLKIASETKIDFTLKDPLSVTM